MFRITPGHLRLLAGAAFLAGCSVLLNSGQEGHPCGLNDACLAGYLCSSKGVCIAENKARCDPECGSGTKCVRQQCVPICEGRACTPGTTCGETGCEDVTATGTVGTPCMIDADCGTDTSLFCLRPYTGGAPGRGVCTRLCQKAPQDTCPAGSVCTNFPSNLTGGANLCANPGLTPCHNDSECTPSGLACEVLFTKQNQDGISANACSLPLDGGSPPGSPCEPGDPSNACANGLCVVSSIGSGATTYFCSTPCGEMTDCAALPQGNCTGVTITQPAFDGGTPNPVVRTNLCILGTPKILSPCQSNANCAADAPHCVQSSDVDGGNVCTPDCATALSDRCPSRLTCDQSSSICR